MKLTTYILQKDSSIIKRKVSNPSDSFEVSYTVDGDSKDWPLNFKREYVFKNKKFFGTENILFYEHGNPNPLSPSFNGKATEIKAIYDLAESKLIRQLVDSAKGKEQFNFMFILGVLGIIGLVLIVIFG